MSKESGTVVTQGEGEAGGVVSGTRGGTVGLGPAVERMHALGGVPAWSRLVRLARGSVRYGLLTVCLLGAVVPFLSIAVTSFKSTAEIVEGIFSLPETWQWDNFEKAWRVAHFDTYFLNSVIVVIAVMALTTLLTVMSGYAFARLRFPLSQVVFLVILLDMMVPVEAYIIPLYYNIRRAGLLDTYWALVLPQVAMGIGFGTFWMRGAFASVPSDLVDAAKVDGGSDWTILWRIMFPVVMPSVLAMVVLFFVWTWSSFLVPLVMAPSNHLRTLPVGLALFQGQYARDIPLTAAGSTIVALPTILVYILFQRHFIRGVSAGALHG